MKGCFPLNLAEPLVLPEVASPVGWRRLKFKTTPCQLNKKSKTLVALKDLSYLLTRFLPAETWFLADFFLHPFPLGASPTACGCLLSPLGVPVLRGRDVGLSLTAPSPAGHSFGFLCFTMDFSLKLI